MFLMILSCTPVAKESSGTSEMQKKITILSATESVWFGGLQNVRGKNYKIVVKNGSKQPIIFKSLLIDREEISVRTEKKGEIYTVRASTTDNPLPNADEIPSTNKPSAKAILLYSEESSKIIKQITVEKFTNIDQPLPEEPVQ